MKRTSESHFNRPEKILLTAAFLVVAGWTAFRHEMWRDELQAWLIARESGSLVELIQNLRYESHPPLWHLLLMPVVHSGLGPHAMQWIHLAIAATTIFIVLDRGPFSRRQKVLFSFGYFTAYEYAAIARNYALGFLFVILLAVRHTRRHRAPLGTAILLSLLAITNAHALLFAALYGAIWMGEGLFRKQHFRNGFDGSDERVGECVSECMNERVNEGSNGRSPQRSNESVTRLLACGSLPVLAALFSAWLLRPKPDSGFHAVFGTDYAPRVHDAAGTILNALVPIPKPDFFFWNTNVVSALAYPEITVSVVAVTLAVLIVWALRSSARAVAIFLGSTVIVAVFGYFFYLGDVRHHGLIFAAFVWAAWTTRLSGKMAGSAKMCSLLQVSCTAVFTAHFLGLGIAVVNETRYFFSSAERTAAFLQTHAIDPARTVAEPDYAAASVLAYANFPSFWNPRTHTQTSFVRWNRARRDDPTDNEVLSYAREKCGSKAEAWALLNHPAEPEALIDNRGEVVAELFDAMVPTENFYLYRIDCRQARIERKSATP